MSEAIDPLIDEVLGRLEQASVPDDVELILIGALQDELDEALGGAGVTRRQVASGTPVDPVRAYVARIDVAGYRGIGPLVSVDLTPGPGLTLIVGRNGSGKSSIAEAAELALTGATTWFADKSAEWTESWRNKHVDVDPEIDVALAVDGERDARVVRVRWTGPALHERDTEVTVPGEGRTDLASLGWKADMATYRPILSYGDLSGLIDGRPVDRYNALAPMLGMDALAEPLAALRDRRLAADKRRSSARAEVNRMVAELRTVDDQRATEAADALAGGDLARAEELATGTAEPSPAEALVAQLTQISAPDADRVAATVAALRSASAAVDATEGTDAERASVLAGVLRSAVDAHDHLGDGDCPLCGRAGGYDATRMAILQEELDRLDAEAATVHAAERAMRSARAEVPAALGSVPAALGSATGAEVGIDLAPLSAAWASWTDIPDEPLAIADHLESRLDELAAQTDAVRAAAIDRRNELEDRWRPVAAQLAAVLQVAMDGRVADEQFGPLKKAEAWLKAQDKQIRDERFTAVRDRVLDVWGTIAVGSNVSLDDVELGAKSVKLRANVDGSDSGALGVMSQGELYALALSLFLPRASAAESPFGFVMIDDPVQAMDPVRVDGLATVLQALASTHQVIVFTHDDRLPSAARRLQIPARVLEVTRRPQSKVELRTASDPIESALDDARAVARTDGLPDDVARRVVPGLCRQALEAACTEAGRRRLLHDGVSHAECEQRLAATLKLLPRLAVALFGDEAQAGDVYSTSSRKWGSSAPTTIKACNEYTHSGAPDDVDLDDLIRTTTKLARDVARL